MKINFPPLEDKEFIQKYLEVCNTLLPQNQKLVDSEMALIIEFMMLPDDKFAYQRFGALAKRKVMENAKANNWNLSKINLNNKLYSLLEKGFLRRDEDKVIYLPKHIVNATNEFRKNKKFEIVVNFSNGKE